MAPPLVSSLGTGDASPVFFQSQAAVHSKSLAEGRPWPTHEIGTGGVASVSFLVDGMGYQAFVVVVSSPLAERVNPFAKQMAQVKAGFGRTMSRLTEVFGVSRQTLYNWLEGDTPKQAQQKRLQHLAEAALVFEQLEFKPTSEKLDRPLSGRKSFLQLMADGASGKEVAKMLVRVCQRGEESRGKLDELLGGRKAKLTAGDFGAPALDEGG